MLDRTERLAIQQPKKEVGLKTSHDKMDLVEVPKFINFPCDMGLIGDPDDIESMGPQPGIPPKQKASLSDEEENKDIAKEISIEIGLSPKQEDTDILQEDAEKSAPTSSIEELKPTTKSASPIPEEMAKSEEITLGVNYFILITWANQDRDEFIRMPRLLIWLHA